MSQYRTIQCMTHDRGIERQSVPPKVGLQRRFDPRGLFAGRVGDGRRPDGLDGLEDPHGVADGFAARVIRSLLDTDAIELVDIEVVGNPRRHEVPGVGVGRAVGHTPTGGLIGLSGVGGGSA